ncbi:hypothetical protein BT69DRAFT_197266 [Atractiella rhizophila]|nr:hypothetical protein BT69DRAFT_197266 [Atractiella rhizophila]
MLCSTNPFRRHTLANFISNVPNCQHNRSTTFLDSRLATFSKGQNTEYEKRLLFSPGPIHSFVVGRCSGSAKSTRPEIGGSVGRGAHSVGLYPLTSVGDARCVRKIRKRLRGFITTHRNALTAQDFVLFRFERSRSIRLLFRRFQLGCCLGP